VAIIETKTYECDCCGRQSQHRDFNNGVQSGSGNLSLSGTSGGMSYNGDWGGCNYNIKKMLCFDCVEKVSSHLNKLSKELKGS
jgi:hypothetical protein